MRSIRHRVLVSAVVTLAVGAVLALPLTYWVTLRDTDELFDERLRQVALAVAASRLAPITGSLAEPHGANSEDEDEIELVTEVWRLDGQRTFSTHPQVGLPFPGGAGRSQVQAGGAWWHVYSLVAGEQVVLAAQPAAERSEMAFDAAWNLGAALLGVFAAVGVALVLALRSALGGLDRAAAAVASRSERSLDPIGRAQVPHELLPLVDAIDGLLRRLGGALTHQRRFVADAAHELRTPVTALKLQWAVLESAPDATKRALATAELGAGIARAQRLVTQLLDLSRAEPDAPMPRQEFDLAELVRAVVAEHAGLALLGGMALRADATQAVVMRGDRHAVGVLLRNLVDNALRHAARSGPVTVAALLVEGAPALCVTDQGPGIPQVERERVFDRFHRQASGGDGAADPQPELDAEVGSGLGLAIVKAVAERHGATLSLGDGPEGRGLRVTVVFRP